jgi:hypothetical protein
MEKKHRTTTRRDASQRVRRWIRRIILCSVVLVLFAVVLIQVLLWTDLPRQYIVRAAGSKLGIKVSAASLSTSWTGSTTIKDLTLTLPIEQDAFFAASEIHLSHTALPMILLKRSTTFKSIDINAPTLVVRQSKAGRWNIQDIVATFAESNGDNNTKPNRINLLRLEITNGKIKIVDPNDETHEIGPMNFHGERQELLSWQFEANIPSKLNLQGVIASGSLKMHRIKFTIDQMDDLLQAWIPTYLCPQYLAGQWDGRLLDQKLNGKLKLDSLRFAAAQVQGSATVQVDPNHILIQPENLSVLQKQLPNQQVNIVSGSINLSPDRIKAEHLVFKSEGLVGRLNAQWNTMLEKGEFDGSWTGTIAKRGIRHAGTYSGSASWPSVGRHQLYLNVSTVGQSPLGNWEGRTEIIGLWLSHEGNNWLTSQWLLSVPSLLWRGKDKDLQLGSTTARLTVDWPKIQLLSFNMANADNVTANGDFSASDRSWSVQFDVKRLRMDELVELPIDIRLVAAGDPNGVNVTDVELTHPGLTFSGAGKIALPSAELRDVQASIYGRMGQQETTGATPAKFAGKWRINTSVDGTAWPVNLEVRSTLIGQDIKAGKLTIASLQAPLQAEIDARLLRFEMEPFALLGGTWQMQGQYAFFSKSGQVNLNVQDLALRNAAKLVESPLSWRGLVTAGLQLDISGLQRDRLNLTGNWSAENVKMPPFQAEHAEGRLSLRNGVLNFEKIYLQKGQGNAQAAMWFSLNQPQNLYVQLKTENWPFASSKYNLGLCADCTASLNLDISKRTATGNSTLSSNILLKNNSLGKLSVNAFIDGRTIQLQDIQMQMLGGQAQGSTRIDLDDWPKSTAELSWQNIQLNNLTDFWPQLEGLTGKASGSLIAGLTDEPRALEPMRLDMDIQLVDASFRKAQLGNGHITAYAGEKRFLIDNSVFEIMDGKLNTRISLSRHANKLFTRIHADLDHLDLDQIVHVIQPKANALTGRLTGQSTITITSLDLKRLTGEAMFHLTESDLINNSIIGKLYSALNLSFDTPQDSGEGWVKLQAQGPKVSIPSILYFNHGIEVRGAGTIGNLSLGTNSTIEGYAVASTHPLKGLRLPGVRELDKLMTSLQTSVASVKVGGTLGKPEPAIVPFPQISSELRRLLWSQLRRSPNEYSSGSR